MIDNIKEMIENGHSVTKVALKLNISVKEVKLIREKNNLSLKHEEFLNTPKQIEYICKLYSEGVSAKKLGKKFRIKKERIMKKVEERGLLRSKEETRSIYNLNEYIFDKIDSSEKVYWLGYIFAHSTISGKNLVISVRDEYSDHLKKLKEFLKSNHNITNLENRYVLSICNEYLLNKLGELGLTLGDLSAKTYPNWLNVKYNSDFIRGLYDGKGSFSIRDSYSGCKLSITSTMNVCLTIHNILKSEVGCSSTYHHLSSSKSKDSYELEITGNLQLKNVFKWLYKNSTDKTRLDNKYEKYSEFLKIDK